MDSASGGSTSEMLLSLTKYVKEQTEIFTQNFSFIIGTALEVCDAKSIEDNQKKDIIKEFEHAAKVICKLISVNLARVSALEKLQATLSNSVLACQSIERNTISEKFASEYEANATGCTDIENNKYYIYYKRTIWEHQNPNLPFDQSKTYLTPSCFDNTQDNSVSLLSSNVRLICPLTKSSLKEPVVNIHCMHFYSKKAILEHITLSSNKTHNNVIKCPVAGCESFVSGNSQIESPYLEKKICMSEQDKSLGPSGNNLTYSFIIRD